MPVSPHPILLSPLYAESDVSSSGLRNVNTITLHFQVHFTALCGDKFFLFDNA